MDYVSESQSVPTHDQRNSLTERALVPRLAEFNRKVRTELALMALITASADAVLAFA